MTFKPEEGFTLLELSIVIGVILILVTIGIVNFGSVRTKSRDSKALYDLQLIKKLIENERSTSVDYIFSTTLPSEMSKFTAPEGMLYCYYYDLTQKKSAVAAIGISSDDIANMGKQTDISLLPLTGNSIITIHDNSTGTPFVYNCSGWDCSFGSGTCWSLSVNCDDNPSQLNILCYGDDL
jgi:prepilin-type N-terminal cleavage/methylation domain-containing protein